MATPEINESFRYVQNDPHKCRIKLGKFHFDILCRFEVIKGAVIKKVTEWGGRVHSIF